LLDTCRAIAAGLDVLERCRFVLGSAEDLTEVADSSVDVVTTRSVLIYVTEKERAFQEFHGVLRPGGRISLFEPINRLSNFFTAYDVAPVQGLADRVRAVYERIQPPESDPMLNFDERDLVEFAERAGFEAIFLRLELEVSPPKPRPWETFVRMVGNPKIPSYGEAIEQALAPDEREQLAAHLRPRSSRRVVGGCGRRAPTCTRGRPIQHTASRLIPCREPCSHAGLRMWAVVDRCLQPAQVGTRGRESDRESHPCGLGASCAAASSGSGRRAAPSAGAASR
jgi:ubiquinone/menaquinone biosynthesis C-methylase UbiE